MYRFKQPVMTAYVFALSMSMLAMPSSIVAGPKVLVGQRVASTKTVSLDRINHRSWDALLRDFVNDQGNVDYLRWKDSERATAALDAYLANLSYGDVKKEATNESRLAFWINAYNALTIKGILREYPTTSIRNHTARLVGYNIWKDLFLLVGGKEYSLDQIEHQVLRKMGDPRIHFAIVCASRSCPRLLNQAFTSENVAALLDSNTASFFRQPSNFKFDAARNRLEVSQILKWFATDFGPDKASQLKWIARYVSDDSARQAAMSGRVTLAYLEYDWGLNDQRR